MLGADSLNLALMVAESGMIDTAVMDLLGNSQVMIMAEDNGVKSSVTRQLQRWRSSVRQRLTRVSEAQEFQEELAIYQEVIHWEEEHFYLNIDSLLERLKQKSQFYVKARHLVEENETKLNPMFAQHFCSEWYKSLSESIHNAQISELEEDKERMLTDLYQRLESIKNMDGVTESGSESAAGRLWDMAGTKLTKSDVASLHHHAEFLRKHKGIQEIADKLGRMASECADAHKSQAPKEQAKPVEELSSEAVDDIVGVHESDDLNKLLPNETLFLTHPELEVVFYKNLIDKRLMNYRTKGKARKIKRVHLPESDMGEPDLDKGPFILCVDASGSMSGFPEQSAKAIAYALMQIALAEERECYVMLFSTELITYELTKQDGLREVSDFLSYRFAGGTDIESAMIKSIQLMRTDRYQNADLVVLSDFIAPKQSEEMLAEVEALKANHNRFHAISLSKYGNPALMTMFDHTWDYHPTMMNRLFKRW